MSCPIESYELASPKLQGNLNLPAIFLHQTTNLFSTKPSTTSVKKHTFSTFAQFRSLSHSIFWHFQSKVIFLQKQPQNAIMTEKSLSKCIKTSKSKTICQKKLSIQELGTLFALPPNKVENRLEKRFGHLPRVLSLPH